MGRAQDTKGGDASRRYTPDEFVRLVGVPHRRLRGWTAAGVLPPPHGRGRAARYSDTHVLLAKAIEKLRSRGVRLRDVRLQLARLDRTELVAFTRPAEADDPAVKPPPAPSYPFAEWQLVELIPGLVLLVNPAKGPVVTRVADEIYRHFSAASPSSGAA